MKLPFLHKTVIGLSITGEAVYWVELVRFGRRTRATRFGSVDVGDKTVEEALRLLAARKFSPNTVAAVSLDADQVEHVIFDVPEMEDEDMLEDWIEHQRMQFTGGTGDTASRMLLLERGDGQLKCITAVAGHAPVHAAGEMLIRAGFVPAYAGDVLLDACAPYLLNDENRTGAVQLVYTARHAAHLVDLRDGAPVAVSEMLRTHGDEPLTFAVVNEDLQRRSRDAGHAVRVIITGDPDVCREASNAGECGGIRYADNMPDLGTGGTHSPLPAEYAAAAGAALRYLNEDLPGFNFLDPNTVEAARTHVERKDATRFILAASLAVLTLLAGSESLNGYLEGRISETEESITAMAGRIRAIEMEETAVKRLQYELDEGRRLVSERTFAAGLIERVGRAMPEGVWLVRIDTYFEPSVARIRLSGHSLDEAGVTALMQQLERTAPFERVRLLQTDTRPAGTRYPDMLDRAALLQHFELEMTVALK